MTNEKEKSFNLRFVDAVMTPKNGLTATQKLVAFTWAHRCTYATGFINESNRGKTSQLDVAKRAELSEKAVRNNTKELILKGWMVEVQTTPGSVSVYQLLIPDFSTQESVSEPAKVTNPGTWYQGTPERSTEVMDEPRNDVLDTPVPGTDNKNDKNVTTKNDYKDTAVASPQLLLASDNDDVFETPSLITYRDADVLVSEEGDADPGTTFRGVPGTEVDDEGWDFEWDTEPIEEKAGVKAEGSDSTWKLFEEADIKLSIKNRASKLYWGQTSCDRALVRALELQTKTKFEDTYDLARQAVREIQSEMAGEEW